jgi:DHA1 family bicyclomycin/chloramphenicol resistance-like MFS transporter
MYITKRYESFLLFLAPLINSIGGITIDLYAPSIPSIGKELGASANMMQNTITVMLIFYAVGQLAFGILADRWGRRPSVLLGLSLFLIGSAVGTFAESFEVLILARAIQGFATGSCQVVARAVLVDNIKGDRFQVAVVYLSLAFGLGPVLAPFIGGHIEELLGWRWNFVVYFGYGLIVLAFTAIGLKESLPQESVSKPSKILEGYREILTNTQFLILVGVLGASFSTFLIWNVIGPYIVQGLGYSPSFFGLTALSVGLAYLVGTLLNRSLIKRLNSEQLMNAGVALFALGVAIVLTGGSKLTLFSAVGGIMVIALAQGLIFSNAIAISMQIFPFRAGMAASLQGCMMIMVGATVSGLVSMVHFESNRMIAALFFCLLVVMVLAFSQLFRLKYTEKTA